MPTYEYLCPKGHTFDVFQRMSDPAGATCPECGEPAERQFSPGAGFLFKGEGFYITDYRSKDYKEKASKESPGGAPKKGGADAKPVKGESGSGGSGSGGADRSSGSTGDSGSGGSSSGSSSGSSGSDA